MENSAIQNIAILKSPVSQVWEAWSNPAHLINWWGPDGFTSTIHTMEFEEGGEWKLTLHGPDGTNYPNRSTFLEIIPQQKIVFEHFNPHFITTALFETAEEGTRLNWTLLFDTPEMREIVVKAHKADEGQKQNIERLAKYLSLLSENQNLP